MQHPMTIERTVLGGFNVSSHQPKLEVVDDGGKLKIRTANMEVWGIQADLLQLSVDSSIHEP
jgi:hypothetical protein